MQVKNIKFNFLAGIALLTMSSIPVGASAQGINRDRSGGTISAPTYQIANRYNRNNRRYHNSNNRRHIEDRISEYYQEILGRYPDSNGLKTFADAVQEGRMSFEQVRYELINSPEGRSRGYNYNNYNRSGYNNRNNRGQIEAEISRYYQEILGRYPDSNGLKTFADAVQEGRMSFEQVRYELINSPEGRSRGYSNNNYNRSGYNNRNNRGQIEAEISRYYQEILGRYPDSNGLKTFADAVQEGRMSFSQVRSELINSPEGRSRSADRNNYNYNRRGYSHRNNRGQIEAEVSRYYQEILGRNPDSNGLKNFSDAVQEGRMSLEQVRNELINSPEGRARNR